MCKSSYYTTYIWVIVIRYNSTTTCLHQSSLQCDRTQQNSYQFLLPICFIQFQWLLPIAGAQSYNYFKTLGLKYGDCQEQMSHMYFRGLTSVNMLHSLKHMFIPRAVLNQILLYIYERQRCLTTCIYQQMLIVIKCNYSNIL